MRIHVATGIRDGHRVWVMKGQRVLIEGTRSFPDQGYATAGIFFKGKEIATTRSPLHGKVGAPERRVPALHRSPGRRLQGRGEGVQERGHDQSRGHHLLGVHVIKIKAPTSPRTAAPCACCRRACARSPTSRPRAARYDDATGRAVLAFRKVNGMARVESASNDASSRSSSAARAASSSSTPGAGRHVEFDWSRQVLVFAQGGRAVRIYHASSGKPSTPTVFGTFHFYSKTPGTNAKGMVDSNYFIGGYAVHGYFDVPPYAASHGCIRVPIPNAASIYNWIRLGETIFVYV